LRVPEAKTNGRDAEFVDHVHNFGKTKQTRANVRKNIRVRKETHVERRMVGLRLEDLLMLLEKVDPLLDAIHAREEAFQSGHARSKRIQLLGVLVELVLADPCVRH